MLVLLYRYLIFTIVKKIASILLLVCICLACTASDDSQPYTPQSYAILSLGDSYTKGEAVCDTCGYPVQLKDSLASRFPNQDTFSVNVIAETGWNTKDLINGINNENPPSTYNLVTLLIGVNNQFQNRPFTWFEEDFPQLVNTATALAKGDKNHVIIISIPDYANTGFGQAFGGPIITEEITAYNAYIQNFCIENNYNFVDAQDLIFMAQTNPELIATDNLHPSELAYSNLVTRLLPLANQILIE